MVYAAKPVDEDGTHAKLELWLILHVVADDCPLFFTAVILVHVLDVGCSTKYIVRVTFIDVVSSAVLIGFGGSYDCFCWLRKLLVLG